ncbi:unnamed protein product [Lathyrus oleraceus]
MKSLELRFHEELNIILKKEELMWFQRSRAKWLTDRDMNTKYYHLKTITRRMKNVIVMLKDEQGNCIEDGKQLKEMVNNYYKQLFQISDKWQNWHQTHIMYPILKDVDIINLDMQVTNDDIKRALFDMKLLKASGPNGFHAGFYQKSWDIVGENICEFVQRIWKKPDGIAEVNQTNICLIPKSDHPIIVMKFRPILLFNIIYI